MLSLEAFEEVSVIGRRFSIVRYEAKILPDRQFISDMLNLYNGHWVEISEQEFENFVDQHVQDYKKVE